MFPEILAQSLKVTNWLTPIWILSVGISIGFVLVLLTLLKIFVLSKLPFFNTVDEKPGLRWGLSVLVSAVYTGLFLWFFNWRFGSIMSGDVILPLMFVIPVSLLIGWGCWSLTSRTRSGESFLLVREGFLSWVNWACIVMVTFAVAGYLLNTVNGFGVFQIIDDPDGMFRSLARLPYAGTQETGFSVKPSALNHSGDSIDVNLNGEEITKVEIFSDQKIEISTVPITAAIGRGLIFELVASDNSKTYYKKANGLGQIPDEPFDKLYVNNLGGGDANIRMIWSIEPEYGQVWLIPWSAAFTLLLYVLYLVWAASFPKMSAIALSTFKTEISQPLFLLVIIIGVVFMVASVYVPYNTFGEDIKMYKDSGLTLIRVLAIFLAIWAAGKSVAEEIEGRTALTVLSKPVGRRQFILGKFAGISMAVAALFIVLGLWFVLWTSYKPIYDGVESSKSAIEWSQCFSECIGVIPALFLAFLEVTIFVAISVAISTRFGILANFLLCFSIYVLGHLTPLIVQSSDAVGAFEPVLLFGQVIAIIFPVLNHFDVQAAINTNSEIPLSYLGWSIVYCSLYGTMAMLLALVLFEDRDLA